MLGADRLRDCMSSVLVDQAGGLNSYQPHTRVCQVPQASCVGVWPRAPELQTTRRSPHSALMLQVLCQTAQRATPLHSSLLGRMCLRVPAGTRPAPTCRSSACGQCWLHASPASWCCDQCFTRPCARQPCNAEPHPPAATLRHPPTSCRCGRRAGHSSQAHCQPGPWSAMQRCTGASHAGCGQFGAPQQHASLSLPDPEPLQAGRTQAPELGQPGVQCPASCRFPRHSRNPCGGAPRLPRQPRGAAF